MTPEEKKFDFLKKVYFGTTDNPSDDVNPFTNLLDFGSSTVGDLTWGNGSGTRQDSKIRFAHNYHRVLSHYNVNLTIEIIFSALIDDKVNDQVVLHWVKKATFNKI